MKVRAIKLGYYDDKRRFPEGYKPGQVADVFEMAEKDYAPVDKNGNRLLDRHGEPRFCTWVEPVGKKKEVAQVASEEDQPVYEKPSKSKSKSKLADDSDVL